MIDLISLIAVLGATAGALFSAGSAISALRKASKRRVKLRVPDAHGPGLEYELTAQGLSPEQVQAVIKLLDEHTPKREPADAVVQSATTQPSDGDNEPRQ